MRILEGVDTSGLFEEWKEIMANIHKQEKNMTNTFDIWNSDNYKEEANIINMKKTKWDKRFFDLCDLVASWSEDTSRKIGAVVIGPSHEIRSIGFNGLPRGVKNTPEVNSRENGEKYYWFEHSERNAIYNAARMGVSLKGCIIYCNLFPCSDCARAIIQSGIEVLKTYRPPENDITFDRSFVVAKKMLDQGDVFIHYFDK